MGRCGANLDFGCGFSIDSVITAVAMVDHIVVDGCGCCGDDGDDSASKPLTAFVDKHPTVDVVFGFLVDDWFQSDCGSLPFPYSEGYLYAAIGSRF